MRYKKVLLTYTFLSLLWIPNPLFPSTYEVQEKFSLKNSIEKVVRLFYTTLYMDFCFVCYNIGNMSCYTKCYSMPYFV